MDISKSLRIAMATEDLKLKEVANRTGISLSYLSQIKNSEKNCNAKMLERLSGVFGMKVSEFIALGE